MSIFPIVLALLLIGLEETEALDGYPLSKINNCKIYCPDDDVCKWTCKHRAGATNGKGDCIWYGCYCYDVAPGTKMYPGSSPCYA
uniref:Toxin To7 n=1 Tax=Tityus obscurus TaxID=1221240 RepID=SCX7_TITOB|nr:RecName: Full=Toxin To7; AltName: Full=PT-alpha* NaTx7.6; AltName: Full=Toxin Tc50; AltName: Full=Toxin To50; Flags: Precursor [Tityus obscurus]CCD31424.1 scorpion toxin To7 precursor [Tityus obscurus]